MSGGKIGFNYQTANNFDRTREQTAPTKTPLQTKVSKTDEYTVKRGDTLTEIAAKTGQNLQELLQKNRQIKNPNKIYVGQKIEIGNRSNIYTVKSGDTLSAIAKAKHTTVGDIMRANAGQIGNRNLIYPGQKLHLPTREAETPTTKPKTTTPTPTPKPTETKTQTEKPPTTDKPQVPTETNAPGTTKPGQTTTSGNLKIAQINLDEFLSPQKGSNAGYAILIGNAEGNRYADGRKTQNYYGHRDPGDGKWNIGSFSYSNERSGAQQAKSPEDADRIQLSRLYKNKDVYVAAMNKARLDPNNALLATVYLDMYNQSPSSAELLLKPDNLKYIKENGVTIETMKEWRYRGFINPETGKQRINSRGKLAGGNLASGKLDDGYAGLANRNALKKHNRLATEDELKALIRRDQNRRVDAMIQPLKNVGLLKIDSSKQTPTQPAPKPQTTDAPQNTGSTAPVKQTGMPDTSGMSESQKFDVYAGMVGRNGNAKAKNDLANGQRVILGLRQETNTRVNNGMGAYDDRMVVMWKDKNGGKHVHEVLNANTEPAGYYEDTPANRANPKRRGKIITADANGDGRGDLGKLTEGTHEYSKSFAPHFGINQEKGYNILRPTSPNNVERDSNHDGIFNRQDANQNKRNSTDSATMYFHRGGRGAFTGSAGCQTMSQADFNQFWKTLGDQKKFQYVVVNVD